MTVCLLRKGENKTKQNNDPAVFLPSWDIMVILGQLKLGEEKVIFCDHSVLFTYSMECGKRESV